MKKEKIIVGMMLLPTLITGTFLHNHYQADNNLIDSKIGQEIVTGTIEEIAIGESGKQSQAGMIVNDGTNDILYTWGSNLYGQSGLPEQIIQTDYPMAVDVDGDGNPYNEGQLSNLNFGDMTSVVVKNNGTETTEIYTWGLNLFGELGNGEYSDSNFQAKPIKFEYHPEVGPLTVKSIDFGVFDSGMVVTDGQTDAVYTWGTNYENSAGTGGSYETIATPQLVLETTPNNQITQFANNNTNMEIVVEANDGTTGILYGWGDNSFGQLGMSNSISSFATPTAIDIDNDGIYNDSIGITALSGDSITTGLVMNNRIYTAGDGTVGELGDGQGGETVHYRDSYKPISTPEGTITALSMEFDNSGSAIINNQLYTWGRNWNGELAQGVSNVIYREPTLVDTTSIDGTLIGLATGFSTLFLLVFDGTDYIIYGAGDNAAKLIVPEEWQNVYPSLTETQGRTYN